MRTPYVAAAVAGVLAIGPLPGAAQTVDGSAEWSVSRNASESSTQKNTDGAFGQSYALGYSSSLFDPRLFQYNLRGLFTSNSLSSRTTGRADQEGHTGDLGYKIGTLLLPASVLPFFFQLSRTRSRSDGQLAPSNPVRSGLVSVTGVPPAGFEALNRELNLGWQLALDRLPQIEVGYRRNDWLTTGGEFRAQQRDNNLTAAVLKETTATRQSLRYQGTQSTTVLQQSFWQRLGTLDYDFGADLTRILRLTLHAGHRNMAARSEFATAVDQSSGAYTAPAGATGSSADYGQFGFDFEPSARFSVHLTGGADRQSSELTRTSARLGTLSTHLELLRGLTLTGSGTAGFRNQTVAGIPLDVSTRSVDGGIAYQGNFRWLGIGASGTRGAGTNTTPQGTSGATNFWLREAHVSTTTGWFSTAAGYEQTLYRDDILDFGNYESQRARASVQAQTFRLSVSLTGEQLHIARGRADTFTRNIQQTLSTTAALRLARQSFLTATGGYFVNDFTAAFGSGIDRSLFWNAGVDAALRAALHVSGWVRGESASATRTGYNQDSTSAFGRVEYRFRTLQIALEYRQNRSLLVYPQMSGPDSFAGRQLRFSVLRQFGARLR